MNPVKKRLKIFAPDNQTSSQKFLFRMHVGIEVVSAQLSQPVYLTFLQQLAFKLKGTSKNRSINSITTDIDKISTVPKDAIQWPIALTPEAVVA